MASIGNYMNGLVYKRCIKFFNWHRMSVLYLILSFCSFPKFAHLRFSYYGNFGFGLLAFVLGFLLALLQLKEPKKEKSNNGPGEGGENKLVSLENLTNSFKVSPSNFYICSYLKDFK